MDQPWHDISLAPVEVPVETKIDDEHGVRNVQVLIRKGQLWFTEPAGGMYVYYTPTHWRHLPRPTTIYTS
jgi:hypothetical protein